MYIKSITRVKEGWRAIVKTSEDGMRYTTIDSPTLTDMMESIEGTMKHYVEWSNERGLGYNYNDERKELKF